LIFSIIHWARSRSAFTCYSWGHSTAHYALCFWCTQCLFNFFFTEF
jgi:hypothetical protein